MAECNCEGCKGACTFKPGWFVPGEVENLVKSRGVTIEEFFKQYLVADWWQNFTEGDIYVLAPALKGGVHGYLAKGDHVGTCVFFVDGKCDIYEHRPFECREYMHDDSLDAVYFRHEGVSKQWKRNQHQIRELLGWSLEETLEMEEGCEDSEELES